MPSDGFVPTTTKNQETLCLHCVERHFKHSHLQRPIELIVFDFDETLSLGLAFFNGFFNRFFCCSSICFILLYCHFVFLTFQRMVPNPAGGFGEVWLLFFFLEGVSFVWNASLEVKKKNDLFVWFTTRSISQISESEAWFVGCFWWKWAFRLDKSLVVHKSPGKEH